FQAYDEGSIPFTRSRFRQSATVKIWSIRSAVEERQPFFDTRVDTSSLRRHMARLPGPRGEVAEWLKAVDCKSARASVRWFESSPLHHSVDPDQKPPDRRSGSQLRSNWLRLAPEWPEIGEKLAKQPEIT